MTDSRSNVLEREEHFADTATSNPDQSVGYQSWNEDNLCVDSYHEDRKSVV